EYDATGSGRIVIRDNAAGIDTTNYQRAFRTADPPPDTKGLAQFGVGMKSAACWFAQKWTVRTTALGEEIERSIEFDVKTIVDNQLERLKPKTRRVPRNSHYTEI